jgi:hypothetical protein
MTYFTKHSHSSVLNPWGGGGKQDILVRIFIMQLSFIEFLYVSAQPLHKVKIAKQNPIEGESASRPIVDFGVLNDNLIKGLISCIR